MSRLVGGQFLDVPFTIQDIPSIGRVCGVSGPKKIHERLQLDAREKKKLTQLAPKVIRWTANEDEVLQQAWEKYMEHGWEAVAANVEGRSKTACKDRGHYKHHGDPEFVHVKCTWKADEDDVLLHAWKKYRAQGWEAVAANVEGRSTTACRLRWSKKHHDDSKLVKSVTTDVEDDENISTSVGLMDNDDDTWEDDRIIAIEGCIDNSEELQVLNIDCV
jgi:hypothetical protein